MGMTPEEYAKLHPWQDQEPEEKQETARPGQQDYMERRDALDKAADLKDSITQQLQQGNAPQYVLYTALQCIGLLTSDQEWENKNRAVLDHVYSNLEQTSLFINEASAAALRLEEMKIKYAAKMRGQLIQDLKQYGRIKQTIEGIIKDLYSMDDFRLWLQREGKPLSDIEGAEEARRQLAEQEAANKEKPLDSGKPKNEPKRAEIPAFFNRMTQEEIDSIFRIDDL